MIAKTWMTASVAKVFPGGYVHGIIMHAKLIQIQKGHNIGI